MKFKFEIFKLNPGWTDNGEDLSAFYDFLSELTGRDLQGAWMCDHENASDIESLWEEIEQVEGPRGGAATKKVHFLGKEISITRKPVSTIHSSESKRWKITVKANPHQTNAST